MKRIIRLLPTVAVLFMSILSCDNEKEGKELSGSQVITLSADKGPFMVATMYGCVSGLEVVALDYECGIEYSTDEMFRDEYSTRQKTCKKYTEDSYSISVSGIQPGKKYYYRAYYVNQLLIYYGEVKTFTFEWTTSEIRGPVDLGLSVKWARCNVGATYPWDYGFYYAWGEIEPKTSCDWSNYKYCNGLYSSLTKYNNSSSYGTVDNKITLDLEDDAAHVNWGGDWRMPTELELAELENYDNCTWTWTTQNGVKGYQVTSKKADYEGASIFLPAAGWFKGSSLDLAGSSGHYWSSSLNRSDPGDAKYLYFYSDNYRTTVDYRYYGYSVRPVCP